LWCRALKRVFDAVAAAIGLIASAPIMATTAIVILIKMGRPVLFRQVRPRLHEKPFTLYKFRTMSMARGPDGRLLGDGARLTPLGRALRRWSIDELPQLWNVLKGDMSLVGPRPLLMEYIDRYTPKQRRRHEVRPGITGWAQINGRNAIAWEDKFRYDVWYVDNCSFWLDVTILAATIWKVVCRRGISSPGLDTMPVFLGSEVATHDDESEPA